MTSLTAIGQRSLAVDGQERGFVQLDMFRRHPRSAAPLAATCFTLALISFGLAARAQEVAADPAVTLKVDNKLVIVPVVVRDKKGALVRSLRKEDFALSENGKPQSIRYFDKEGDAPLTVGLLVDVSGSQRNVLDEERTASSAFLDTLLRPDKDKAFIVQFGREADLLADVTGSLPKLEAGLKKLDADADRPQFNRDPQDTGNGSGDGNGPNESQNGSGSGSGQTGSHRGGRSGGRGNGRGMGGGGTVMYDAIFLSSDEVIKKQTNRKALILLTDGNDRGSKESLTESIEAAQRANATVYAIYFKGEEPGGGNGGGRRGGGFPGGGGGWPGGGGGWPGGGGRNGQGGGGRSGGQERTDGKKILERICDETGGRVFEVTKKESVDTIYKDISEELRSEYRLGFTPSDTSDGYHHVVVDLPKDQKSTIQAREGYYIGAQ